MAGGNAKGAHHRIGIKQKKDPAYTGGGIDRESDVDVVGTYTTSRFQLGLRILAAQTAKLALYNHKGNLITLTPEPSPYTIAQRLQAIAPSAGEQWVVWTGQYDDQGGPPKFSTSITVNPFNVDPNGFQVVVVAADADDGVNPTFSQGYYLVGTSILPGANFQPFVVAKLGGTGGTGAGPGGQTSRSAGTTKTPSQKASRTKSKTPSQKASRTKSKTPSQKASKTKSKK